MHLKPMERGWKPRVEISPTCPRCGSSNTKFCYYNNYSLTQPRYFCKACRRYWTKGGSLRNVPVGGGCRKTRRGKPIRDVISMSSRIGSGLGRNGVSTPIFSSSPNGSLAGPDHHHQGPNIDLALVYANFLNPKPRIINEAANFSPCHPQIEIPLLPNSGCAPMSFQFPCPLSQVNGFADQCRPLSNYPSSETQFTTSFYFSGPDSIEKQTDYDQLSSSVENPTNNYGLPPLPGEDLNSTMASEGLVWSGSNNDLLFPSHTDATQLSGIEEQTTNAAAPQEQKQLGGTFGSQMNMPIEFCNVFRP